MVVNAHKVGSKSRVAIEGTLLLITNKDLPRNYDLVIVDEAHHYPAKTWKLLVDYFSNTNRLFLTATPLWRGKPILEEQQKHVVCVCVCVVII